jgi:outer membrane protein TolC
MKRIFLIIILLVVVISIEALTLEQCIGMARLNNKEILSAREDIAMADQTYYDVRGLLLPQISLQGGYQLNTSWLPESNLQPDMDFKDELDNTASHNDSTLASILTGFANSLIPDSVLKEGSITGQIKLDQILFSGGKLINGINAVNRYRSIQKLRFKLIEQDVISKTTEMYYQTILSKKVFDIQQEAINTASKHLERVELLNREGQVSEFDLLRAQLEVAKIRPDVVQAQNMYDLSIAAFKKQIGFAQDELILDQEISLPPIQNEDLQTALNLAQSHRIELKLSAINTEISKIKYSAEKGNYLPVVGFTAGYSVFTSADEYRIERDDFGTAFSAGIGFSIPLFTGLSNTAKRSYAKHEYYQSKIQETNGKEMIDLEVRQTWQNLQHALQSYQVQQDNIRLSERSLELAQVRFENQVGIQLEVFDAQMTLNSVKLNYYNTIYEVIIANQKFRKAMGYIL